MLSMNMDMTKINEQDFAELKGTRLLVGKDIERVASLSFKAHTGTEIASEPFWATQIQDIIEQKAVVYSPEDIHDGMFLGARIQATEDTVEVSLGFIGNEASEFAITFKKELDTEGFQVLGEIVRFGNVGHVA